MVHVHIHVYIYVYSHSQIVHCWNVHICETWAAIPQVTSHAHSGVCALTETSLTDVCVCVYRCSMISVSVSCVTPRHASFSLMKASVGCQNVRSIPIDLASVFNMFMMSLPSLVVLCHLTTHVHTYSCTLELCHTNCFLVSIQTLHCVLRHIDFIPSYLLL